MICHDLPSQEYVIVDCHNHVVPLFRTSVTPPKEDFPLRVIHKAGALHYVLQFRLEHIILSRNVPQSNAMYSASKDLHGLGLGGLSKYPTSNTWGGGRRQSSMRPCYVLQFRASASYQYYQYCSFGLLSGNIVLYAPEPHSNY